MPRRKRLGKFVRSDLKKQVPRISSFRVIFEDDDPAFGEYLIKALPI